MAKGRAVAALAGGGVLLALGTMAVVGMMPARAGKYAAEAENYRRNVGMPLPKVGPWEDGDALRAEVRRAAQKRDLAALRRLPGIEAMDARARLGDPTRDFRAGFAQQHALGLARLSAGRWPGGTPVEGPLAWLVPKARQIYSQAYAKTWSELPSDPRDGGGIRRALARMGERSRAALPYGRPSGSVFRFATQPPTDGRLW